MLSDMVWPAVYLSQTLWKFWFLVIGTIIIETFVIKYFLRFNWKKAFMASFIGNCVSGFVGTFIMVWGMLFWHLIVDQFVNGTFNLINWIATYVLMCLGSVFLEALAIKLIYKEKIKRLFVPMLTGNFLSYVFIAYVMFTATKPDSEGKTAKTLRFLPGKRQFVLLDDTKMNIDTSFIMVSFDKNGKNLNGIKLLGYNLTIPFNKEKRNSFQFDFRIPGETFSGGIDDTVKVLHFIGLTDEYKIVLEQKNPDTSYGWKKPIVTDTLIFRRID
jgi:hypothetical protein